MANNSIVLSLMIVLCCKSASCQTIVFDDGQDHVLTEDAETVSVSNQSNLDLQANAVDVSVDNATLVQNGGEIGGVPGPDSGLTVLNGSNVFLNSGKAYNVTVDAATLSLAGAEIHGWDDVTMSLANGANVSLQSGTVDSVDPAASALVSVDSIVHIDGATLVGRAKFEGTSTAVVKAGIVGGGDQGIVASDTSVVTITGGVITGRDSAVSLMGESQVSVHGGQLEGLEDPTIRALQDSAITIYGGDFNFPLFEPIEPLTGVLTGTLSDGSSFEWSFERESSASIVLVPEPSATLLFALAAAFTVLRTRRERVCN